MTHVAAPLPSVQTTRIARRILLSPIFWIGLFIVMVTGPLLYWASHPLRVVEVYLQPLPGGRIVLPRTVAVTRSDGRVAYVDWYGETLDNTIERVTLEIHPDTHPTFIQVGTYDVRNGEVRGVLPLGSQEWPLVEDARYTFRLVDSNGRVVLEGRILADVTTVAGGDQSAIAAIGLLASVIQILEALARYFLRGDG
jgi:hypothetical protein